MYWNWNQLDRTETTTLANGIKGDLRSLCGAMKRFQCKGKQWNGLLSLKEQCARRIALIKNEQMKYFILGCLPTSLFKYVTKDIFNLRRDDFISNYPSPFDLCNSCSVVKRGKRQFRCQCPKIKKVICLLNNYFAKRMNNENTTQPNKIKKFEVIYEIPDDDAGDWGERKSYFLYLSPYEDYSIFETDEVDNMDYIGLISVQTYKLIKGQPTVEEKFLFVDAMRFLGGFQCDLEQPQLISCYRCTVER